MALDALRSVSQSKEVCLARSRSFASLRMTNSELSVYKLNSKPLNIPNSGLKTIMMMPKPKNMKPNIR
jgi:hypothetical protein